MRDGRLVLACFLVALLAILVVSISWYFLIASRLENSEQTSSACWDFKDNIRIDLPIAESRVALPLQLSGDARVFENVVNIEVQDEAGQVLYHGVAIADSSASGEFGRFSHQIYSLSDKPTSNRLLIRIFWVSPSADAPRDVIEIPVTLNLEDHRLVKLFYGASGKSDSTCAAVASINRFLGPSQTPLAQVLTLLLHSELSRSELGAGLVNHLPTGLQINTLTVAENGLQVDLSEELKTGIGNSCQAAAARAQLEATLKQFGTVFNIIFSANGSTEGILEGL